MKQDQPAILKFDEANHNHTSVSEGGLLPPLGVSTAGKVWASPETVTGTAYFRPLVSTDIPMLDWSKINTGKPTALSGYASDTPWTGMGYLTSQISHSDVVVDGDFTTQGILIRGAVSGVYSTIPDNSANWNTAYSNSHIHANLSALNSVSGVNTGDNSPNSLYSGLVSFPGFGTDHTHAAYGDHTHAQYLTDITKAQVEAVLIGVISTHSHAGGGGSMVYPPAGIAVSTGTAWAASITNNSANWNTAFSWGNHALAGYITGAPWTGYGYLTGITSGQVTGALGFTPYSNTNPSGFVGAAGARTAISLTTTGTSGEASYNSGTGVLNIPQYSGSSGMVYPGAGIPLSTGSAWGVSIANNSANWNTAYTHSQTSHAYLPLAGGTLTGALNGTTSAFTGNVTGSKFTLGATLWTIEVSTGRIVFKYNNVELMSFDSSGNIKAVSEIYRGGL